MPPPAAFRRLWAAAGAANLADGLVLVAAPLLALQLTRDPLAVSLVTTAAGLPWLAASLHAGALADRLPRHRLAAGAHAARAAVLAAAAATAAAGHLSLPVLYAAVLLYGLGEVFADTATQALVPSLVPSERLEGANARLVATETVGNNFLGAPLAGVLIGLGAALTLAVPAVAYALAAALLTGARTPARDRQAGKSPVYAQTGGDPAGPGRGRRGLAAEVGEGLRFLLAHRVLRALAVLAGLANLANGAYFALLVLWLVGPGSALGLSTAGYGLLAAALAAGAVTGSLLTSALTRHAGAMPTMLTALALQGALMALLVAVPRVGVVTAAVVVLGAASAIGNVLLVTTRQRLVPEALLGRVTAAYRLISRGTTPLGALAGGALATTTSVPTVLWGASALTLLAVAITARPIATVSAVGAPR